MTRRLRVGVLFGGRSAEHEISILSARNVVAAMDRSRFEPVLVGIDKQGRWLLQKESMLLQAPADPRLVRLHESQRAVAIDQGGEPGSLMTPDGAVGLDVVFPVLHGPMGEDGTVQGLLELAGVPYVGCGVLGSAVGMDKDVAKRLLRDAGIAVADFRVVTRAMMRREADVACALAAEVGFPLFTKPANLGSSVGVRRVAGWDTLRGALVEALGHDGKALAEEAVRGREIECAVLGNDDPEASVPGEIVVDHADGFYSYDAKYVDEKGAVLRIPAELDDRTVARVKQMAIAAFKALECRGLARVDFFLRDDGELLVNEINTMPGFTNVSMYPKLWEASGVAQKELVTRLIDLSLEQP